MKGKAIIELNDVKTGEKEVYEENNMVTNALRDLFATSIDGMLVSGNGQRFIESCLPICPNALGGILLFSDPLEENPDKYYAPSSNPCVGYASNDSHSTQNPKRGNLNSIESGPIENGYKLVWDFATSQANGTISSLALTHAMGGKSYMGDEYGDWSTYLLVENMLYNSSSNMFARTVDIDFEKGIFTIIYFDTEKNVVIRKIKKPLLYLNLTYDLEDNGYEIIEEVKIKPNNFNPRYKTYNYYYMACFEKDGFYYCFNTGTGDNKVQWLKINQKNYQFEEGVFDLKGYAAKAISNSENIGQWNRSASVCCGLRGEYLYLMPYDRNYRKIALININQPADIRYINTPEAFSNHSQMFQVNDWVMTENMIINSKNEISKTKSKDRYNGFRYLHQYKTFLYFYRFSKTYNAPLTKELHLLTPYLATINNLASPVVKTADKTMKITYIITEEV